MLCAFSDVDTEFLNVIYINVISKKFTKAVNAASVLILRLLHFTFPIIFIGLNFVIHLHSR
jgi:hypothetical protein